MEWEIESKTSHLTKKFFPTVESDEFLRPVKPPQHILTGHSSIENRNSGNQPLQLRSRRDRETLSFDCRKLVNESN